MNREAPSHSRSSASFSVCFSSNEVALGVGRWVAGPSLNEFRGGGQTVFWNALWFSVGQCLYLNG